MDDVERLILEIKGREEVAALTAELEKEKEKLTELAAQFRAGATSQAQFDAASRSSAQHIVGLQDKLKDLKGFGGISGQGLMGASYGIQDMVTVLSMGGGFGRALMSAANNITPMVMALGGGAGLAGVIGLVVTGLAAAIPALESFAESLFGGDEKAKAQAAALKDLIEAGKKLKTQLEELTATSGTRLKALVDENQALERQVKIEEARQAGKRRAADEDTKRQAEAAKMEGAPSLEEQRRMPGEKARAADIKKIVGGDPEAQAIARAVRQSIESELTRNGPTGGWNRDALRKEVEKARNETLGRFYGGDAHALEQVMQSLHPMLGHEGTLREQLGQFTPEAERARRMQRVGETVQGFGRHVRDKVNAEAKKKTDEAATRRKHLNAEVKAMEEENARWADETSNPEHTATKLRHDIKLGRRVGRAALIDDAVEAGKRKTEVPSGHLPMLPINPTAGQLAQAMLQNQEQMTRNMAQLQAMQARAANVGRQQGQIARQNQQPAMSNGWN